MKFIPLPPQQLLREHFDYNPWTGVLSWRIQTGKMKPGKQAGSQPKAGDRTHYPSVRLHDRIMLMHRVIYKWMTGEDPEYIDHINQNKSDNRWANIRSCTQAQNNANIKRQASASGYKCVYPNCTGTRWVAQITNGGKRRHIGTYDTPEEASAAYMVEARKAWGEFARAK